MLETSHNDIGKAWRLLSKEYGALPMSEEERIAKAKAAIDAILKAYGCELTATGNAIWLNGVNGIMVLQATFQPNTIRALPDWTPVDEQITEWNDYLSHLGEENGR